jgi:hypothetical protein
MKSFRTVLLINTLRAIIAELEQIDPNSASLPQLKFTLQQKLTQHKYGTTRASRC